jgi:hypothetical protein
MNAADASESGAVHRAEPDYRKIASVLLRSRGADLAREPQAGLCAAARRGQVILREKTMGARNRRVAARLYEIMRFMKASWRIMLNGAIDEALLAVDLYNQPRQPRRLEGFLVHMHMAWLYLLHAEFRRDGVEYRYRLPNGRFDRVDGEPKTWDLQKSVAERWPTTGAVRKNLELTIALRNKVEHRYHEAITLATSGFAQALVLNFEEELTSAFDTKYSLGEQLRFPIFVGAITALGNARLEELRAGLPRTTRDFLARFESGLDPTIAADQRYEFRIQLVPKTGPKSQADRAVTFVREADLTGEERKVLESLGRTGAVVVREQTRAVANSGLLKPSMVAQLVEERIPFQFKVHHVVRAWQNTQCRPPSSAARPERTTEKYCIYDAPHQDYLYSQAFVEKIVRETSTAGKFRAFTGLDAIAKAKA